MPYSVEGKLVVAISSRALFDFEEENRVFEKDGEPAYIALQYARLDVPARQGVAFPLVKKLLAFGPSRVEVVVLSKNDPVSGLRVFRSAKQAGLAIERGVFTRGRSPYQYLEPLKANLFLSANEGDVMGALQAKVPAARVYPESAKYQAPPRQPRGERPRDAAIDQFVAACKGGAPAPLANFEIQSPVTEAFLLGCIAQRFPGERIEWDTANMRITNSEKLQAFVDPPGRPGFAG